MTNFNEYDNGYDRKEKSSHNMSHKNIFDLDFGNLVPFLFEDVIPGDEIDLKSQIFLRFSPLVAPQMSEIDINLRFFFVPYRLLYNHWNDFYMRMDTSSNINSDIPYIELESKAEFADFYNRYGKIYRHFGISESNPNFNYSAEDIEQYPTTVNLMPYRAYNQIYYWYYLPLEFTTDARGRAMKENMCENDQIGVVYSDFKLYEGAYLKNFQTADKKQGYYQVFNYGDYYTQIHNSANIQDIAIGATTSSFKIGRSMQKFFDTFLGAKGRFNRYSKMLFGVSPRTEYDRPIYIGGITKQALIGDVEATTEQEGQPLASFAGKGTGFSNYGLRFNATEFGYIVGLIDVTPRIQYAKFEHERITYSDYLDVYRPEFESTFINQVKSKHAHQNYGTDPATYNGDAVFGYSVPYNQYRFPRNLTLGKMSDNLDYWNVLNDGNVSLSTSRIATIDDFNDANPNETDYWHLLTKKLFAVPTEPQMFVECYNSMNMQRIIKHELNSILTQ